MAYGVMHRRGGLRSLVVLIMSFAGSLAAREGSTTYGCKFSRGLCRLDEVCVDDNLFGSCQDATAAGSWNPHTHPVFVLDSRLRRLLEVVMHDLVQGGYSWRDVRTQCVISAVLSAYEERQPDVRTGACDALALDDGGIESRLGYADDTSLRGAQRHRVGAELPSFGDLMNAAAGASRSDHIDDDGGIAQLNDERLRLLRPAAAGGAHDSDTLPLSHDDLQALELFLRLSDGGTPAIKSPTSLASAVARPPGGAADLGAQAASAASRPEQGHDNSNRPEPAPLRKIDEELVGRLLRDEVGVDELMPEEIHQLTLFIKAILKDSAEPLAGSGSRSSLQPDFAKQTALSSRPTQASNSVRSQDAISPFIEESMVQDRAFAGPSRDSLPFAETGGTLHGGAVAANARPPAAAASDADLEAELKRVSTNEQPALLEEAARRVYVSPASTLVANEPYVDVVDSSYGWVKFASSIDPQEAKLLLFRVAQKLGLANGSINDLRVKDDEVFFHVLPNDGNINATEVAKAVAEHGSELVSVDGGSLPDVHSVGIGRGESLLDIGDAAPEVAAVAAPRSRKLLLAMSLVGGTCVLAIVIAFTVVCVLRKRRSQAPRDKLARDERRGIDSTGSGDSLLARDEYEDLVRRERSRQKTGDDYRPAPTGDADGSGRGEDYSSQHSGSVSSWSEEPAIANMDVSTGHMVLSYMEDHLKNKERLDKEWQDLCAYEADPNATNIASLHKNRKKNRSLAVLPYDHNRVVLDEKNNVASEDYINASFIVDHDPRSPAYIATQGPLVHTVADFWQMVWEQGCVVIAMLTRLSEGSVAMCHRYWPHDSSELYHIYEVHLVSEHVWSDDYLVRSFYLKNLETNETRTVTQFHYLAWPEGGVPAASKSLLDFRRKVNKSYRGRSRPVMVVCSDGAGRTGSFILLDMVINRMNKGAKEIDIAATLEFLRDQRMGTVKTQEQFEFVLTSVAEEVQAVLRASPH